MSLLLSFFLLSSFAYFFFLPLFSSPLSKSLKKAASYNLIWPHQERKKKEKVKFIGSEIEMCSCVGREERRKEGKKYLSFFLSFFLSQVTCSIARIGQLQLANEIGKEETGKLDISWLKGSLSWDCSYIGSIPITIVVYC